MSDAQNPKLAVDFAHPLDSSKRFTVGTLTALIAAAGPLLDAVKTGDWLDIAKASLVVAGIVATTFFAVRDSGTRVVLKRPE